MEAVEVCIGLAESLGQVTESSSLVETHRAALGTHPWAMALSQSPRAVLQLFAPDTVQVNSVMLCHDGRTRLLVLIGRQCLFVVN
jgi:hypothetical protein